MLRKIVIFLFMLSISLLVNGQYIVVGSTLAIKIDSATRMADQKIPFDQPFTIILTPSHPETVVDVMAFPVVRMKEGKPGIDPNSRKIHVVSIRRSGPQWLIEMPALLPNTSFDLYLKRKLDDANLAIFLNYASRIANEKVNNHNYTLSQKQEMNSSYRNFYRSLYKIPGQYGDAKKLYSTPVLANFLYDFLYEVVCDSTKGMDKCENRSLDNLVTKTMVADFKAIFDLSTGMIPYPGGYNFLTDLKTVSQHFRTEKLNDQTISSLIRIYTAGKENEFLNGLYTLDFQYQSKPGSKEDITVRLNNVQNNYQKLSGLQDTLERISNEATPADPVTKRASDYLKQLVSSVYLTKTIVEASYDSILSTFQTDQAIFYPEWYVNNTDGYKDLQSESGVIFSPQLGISFLGVSKNLGGNQIIPKLSLGVNINFRAINKNLIRKDIPNRDWRNYLSGFVGLTFGAFHDPEYQNLFSSSSLLAGFNYRVTRSFYISTGAAFFRQQNLNPVINDFHTEVGIYMALLLDIDIVSAASSVTSILFK